MSKDQQKRQLLHHRERSLRNADHLRELMLDHLVIDEAFAEGLAAAREAQGFRNASLNHARALRAEEPALVVEVEHCLLEALTDDTDNVRLRDLDVLELHERRARRPNT